jgi:hypothetical protein
VTYTIDSQNRVITQDHAGRIIAVSQRWPSYLDARRYACQIRDTLGGTLIEPSAVAS